MENKNNKKRTKKEIPKLSYPIFETHFHFDYLKDLSKKDLLEKSKEYSIKKLITIAVSPEHLEEVVQLTQTFENMYCTQGIHPHEAHKLTPEIFQQIKKNLEKRDKVVAVGEIGLDFHYDHCPRKIQIEVFEKFLELAISLDKPMVIHTREAEDDTISILKNILNQNNKNIVLHSFTSNKKLADFAIKNNLYFGVNGIITFNKSEELRNIIQEIPMNLLVLETDSPFLAPHPFRGKENAPYYLPVIAKKLAEIKKLEVEQLLKQCWINSHQLFDLTFEQPDSF